MENRERRRSRRPHSNRPKHPLGEWPVRRKAAVSQANRKQADLELQLIKRLLKDCIRLPATTAHSAERTYYG
jgi:hypothetical protein